MIEAKTEITVNYTTVIDFASHGRRVMAPFRQFASSVKVENVNRPAERVILIFEDEAFFMDCMWERAALVVQENRNNLKKESGRGRFFFQALDRISELEGFTQFTTFAVKTLDVLKYDTDTDIRNAEEFLGHYFSDKLPHVSSVYDAAYTLNFREKHYDMSLEIGPYKQREDMERHGLQVFPGGNVEQTRALEHSEGLLVRMSVESENRDPSPKLLRSMLDTKEEIISRLP